jgi:sugar/nucleoside kinase (ribokinase family)
LDFAEKLGERMQIGIVGITALDRLLYADSAVTCAGGKGLVTALGLRRLAHAPRLLSLVGRASVVAGLVPAPLGRDLARVLDCDHRTWIGIGPDLSVRPYVRLGRRVPGCELPDVAAHLRGLDVVVVAHEEPALVRRSVEAASGRGAEVVTNLSAPLLHRLAAADPGAIGLLIDRSDVLLMNDAESALALRLAGGRTWADVASARLREVVVTEGRAGGWCSARPFRRRHRYRAARPEREVTPVGAGDTFTAGYVDARYAGGLGLRDACDAGARLAAEKVAVPTSSL